MSELRSLKSIIHVYGSLDIDRMAMATYCVKTKFHNPEIGNLYKHDKKMYID